jgi:hypothetical protein
MSKTFAEVMREERRLVILRILADSPQYRTNSSVLASMLEHLGVPSTRDQVNTDLDWLAEQGLVVIEDLDFIRVAVLTARGGDVACGKATVSGVKRPSAH